MTRFELKKVFSKGSSKIALLLTLVFLLYMIGNANYLLWISEDNTELTGKQAAEKLRQAEQEWYGPLTEEKIAAVLTQGWTQGNRGIRILLARAFGGLDNTDSTVVDSLGPEDAGSFYDRRISSLKEWLEAQGDWYTDGEKEFLTGQYEALETPLDYEYAKGWSQLFSAASSVQMFLVLVIGFLVAGIFSEEYRTGASSIFFSSALGRGRAVRAKLRAGFLLITAVYWLSFALFSAGVLLELGAQGFDCGIQISSQGWKSFYNITFLQEYLLIAGAGYLGCLSVDSLSMLVSARTKSTVVSVILPFAALFSPAVVRIVNSPLAEKIEGLMPYQLTQMNSVIREFYLYPLFGKYVGGAWVLLILYAVLSGALQPAIYLIYRGQKE